jgi:hypothetical protein
MTLFLLAACNSGIETLGQGDPLDASLTVTAKTWSCAGALDTGASSGEDIYDGVWDFHIGLAYAPDAIEVPTMPSGGACTDGLDLFAQGAGDAAMDLPDVETPGWFNGTVFGELAHGAPGWYFDEVIEDQQACSVPEDVFGDDVQLTSAGSFTGARAPSPGATGIVTVTGVDNEGEVDFGGELTVVADITGWDRTFLHVRRESEGEMLESVTCDTSGLNNLTIGDPIWGAFSTVVKADGTMLYVGFENDDEMSTKDGQRIAVRSRVLRSVVVN